MNAKEKAELIINQLRGKGYSDDDIAAAVVDFLTDMNTH